MKVKVNEGCLGCGACAGVCPDVFELDDEGLAKVIVDETEDPAVQDAIDGCPVGVNEAE